MQSTMQVSIVLSVTRLKRNCAIRKARRSLDDVISRIANGFNDDT